MSIIFQPFPFLEDQKLVGRFPNIAYTVIERGTIPLDFHDSPPHIVYVLPEPVWPYAIIVQLEPESSYWTNGLAMLVKSASYEESVSNILVNWNSYWADRLSIVQSLISGYDMRILLAVMEYLSLIDWLLECILSSRFQTGVYFNGFHLNLSLDSLIYHINVIILNDSIPIHIPLLIYLHRNPHWSLVGMQCISSNLFLLCAITLARSYYLCTYHYPFQQ